MTTATKSLIKQEWCVIGSYVDDDGYPMIEVMSDGCLTQPAASEVADQMRKNCPEIRFDVHTAEFCEMMGWHETGHQG